VSEILLDRVVSTHLAWFFLHDNDDRFGVLPDGDDVGQVVETADGVAVLLGDPDGQDEVPVRVRVLRDPAAREDRAEDEPVFDQTLFLYGTGLVVEDGHPSTRHVLELGGPGRVRLRLHLDVTADPPAVTVVLGDLEPDRSVLPPRRASEVVRGWWRAVRRLGAPR
jgi:hypothetical protein